MTAKIYTTSTTDNGTIRAKWLAGNFEVIGRRADETYPKAYLISDDGDKVHGYYCAARKTGSFEFLSDAAAVMTFVSRDAAIAHAAALGFAA